MSYNKITGATVNSLKELICDHNKTLEFIGLAKNDLTIEDLEPLLQSIGRKPMTEGGEEALAKMKERDQIIAKNKKLKASKKPEEPVPIIDDVEQNDDGSWVMLQNCQIRHINLCMNKIGDDSKDVILDLLKRTGQEFSITLSGTQFSREVIQEIWDELSTEENPDQGLERLLF